MKRTLALSVALALGTAGSALAEPRATYKWTNEDLIGSQYKAPNPAAVAHTIYMNNCKPNGCTLHPGYDNATTDTSSQSWNRSKRASSQ